MNYVLDDENYYNSFPGRGVRLRVEGIDEHHLPDGMYRFTIAGVPSTGGAILQELTHEFEIRLHKLPPFAEPHAIVQGNDVWESQRDQTRDVVTADLDGDDDEDVLKISSNRIAWFENVTGTAEFGPPRIIALRETAGHAISPTSVAAADVDNDGDLDVLSIERYGRLAWYENQDGLGRFGPRRTIGFLEPSPYGAPPALAADLDSDGDADVLINDRWFENIDGLGTFRQIQLLNVDAYRTIPADLDNDGDLDLVSAENDQSLAWYENTDGFANFGSVRPIHDGIDAEYVAAADLDDDGDLDLVTRQRLFGPLVWFENTDTRGTFGPPQTISDDVEKWTSRIFTGDVDGDQDLDVLIGNAWYENTNGQADFGPPSVIGRLATDFKSTADLDQDGDLDLIFGSSHYVVWQPNLDGLGAFGDEQIIGEGFTELVQALDIDGDGDLDIVSAETNIYDDQQCTYRSELVWREHLDGREEFGMPKLVWSESDSGSSRWESLLAFDVDGDEDLDLVWAGIQGGEGKTIWLENLDGKGTFGAEHTIDVNSSESALSLSSGDMDGDGDDDLVAHLIILGGGFQKRIVWYENSDGLGDFGEPRVISGTGEAYGPLYTVDLDADGDQDVVGAAQGGGVAWYQNVGGSTTFIKRAITTQNLLYEQADFVLTDLDADGDLDVLARREFLDPIYGGYGRSRRLVSYENINGRGTFGAPEVITTNTPPYEGKLFAADLDGDGDPDIVAQGRDDSMNWFENLLAHPGDANRDGRFDSGDLIQVLSAGEYEDNIAGNSTWEEGDWNDDGDFDSTDLVVALATGNYERQSHAMTAAIAAAVDSLFADDESPKSKKALVA